ncbi:hypothetical protein [uncultured Corynebacterium sp.]|uniref:hypothetical protein n=1 Tax=uncultured Corynebacterium sp. TaxID=159447 RepID=UPI00262CAAE7|nr:hypothetical protein [uncultured Corynebacterium sp.]
MKRRFIAASLATATALSLSVAPAHADIDDIELPMTSSYESSSKRIDKRLKDANASGNPKEIVRAIDIASAFEKFMQPSYDNDLNNGYKLGTTFDILWGTGLAVAILAAAGGYAYQNGMIQLPF